MQCLCALKFYVLCCNCVSLAVHGSRRSWFHYLQQLCHHLKQQLVMALLMLHHPQHVLGCGEVLEPTNGYSAEFGLLHPSPANLCACLKALCQYHQ